jgi:hypothetical protein
MRLFFSILAILIINSFTVKSQLIERRLVQFSGVVVTGDSLKPVPFTNITVRNKNKGVTADFYGFFSFVARESDTLDFTSMGYKHVTFVVPDTLSTSRYSLIQVMSSDTVYLTETLIYPWPTRAQFKQAFLNLVIPDDDYERAMKNLAYIKMRELLKNMPMDAEMNYNNFVQKQTSRLYYAGQLPPNNLLNPFAWAQFIKAWQEGKFKQND